MSDGSDYELDDTPKEGDIGIYEGDRNEHEERHGHGKCNFPNGDVYEGEYIHGRRHGYGTYCFKNGRYEGEYVDGKKHGRGRMHFPDGSLYEGEWCNGEKSGVGTYTYRNGDVYEGDWKNDQKHGKGVYTYMSTIGTQFKGNWSEGVREGPAEWFHKGHSFKGYFRNDNPFGRGKFTFDIGCEQHGYYNFVEHVDRQMEVNGRETRWTYTSLVATNQKYQL